MFVSNTCMLESDKAKQLSAVLGFNVSGYFFIIPDIHGSIQVHPEQVVLAQTPMRTLTEYHNKHVLVSGQGVTEEIARMYV